MANVKTSGPKKRQIVLYLDAVYGSIAAIITQVNSTPTGDGGISLTTFPPGVAPQNQTEVLYDNPGTIVGRGRYEQEDYS